MNKKELVIEFEYIEKQIKKSSEKLDQFDRQVALFQAGVDAINQLSAKEEHKALVPIVDGVYVNATIKQSNSFVMDVGADTAIVKSKEEAIEILSKQLKIAKEYQDKLVERMHNLSQRADELHKKMQQVQK